MLGPACAGFASLPATLAKLVSGNGNFVRKSCARSQGCEHWCWAGKRSEEEARSTSPIRQEPSACAVVQKHQRPCAFVLRLPRHAPAQAGLNISIGWIKGDCDATSPSGKSGSPASTFQEHHRPGGAPATRLYVASIPEPRRCCILLWAVAQMSRICWVRYWNCVHVEHVQGTEMMVQR
ncbi:uncharacterized protein M421DRAFT_421501 [Didymella exigua CBS 183.55]|uniref:Uncharacterized protein n=1 Tax=Didymella exigua CBS 183.55 TaxID=1150837 RepID=A0A6A5RH43_9PLEO|nr:uncharacterized protein M421DRAFT_421501 [Didymella exigua CBS 183.55]KAF1927661.1 hypothetical protein M421DRAFT_421501 [Didymella exigua CBS 183.55]